MSKRNTNDQKKPKPMNSKHVSKLSCSVYAFNHVDLYQELQRIYSRYVITFIFLSVNDIKTLVNLERGSYIVKTDIADFMIFTLDKFFLFWIDSNNLYVYIFCMYNYRRLIYFFYQGDNN